MTPDARPVPAGPSGGAVGEWLAGREASPPPELRERVSALARGGAILDAPVPQSLLSAAAAALERLARSGASDRATALDLLAVDALVTYAFEAAAESPGSIPVLSAGAMARLSAAAAA